MPDYDVVAYYWGRAVLAYAQRMAGQPALFDVPRERQPRFDGWRPAPATAPSPHTKNPDHEPC